MRGTSRRLALLLCHDSPPPIVAVHGSFTDLFFRLLSLSLARIRSDVSFRLDTYDVVNDMSYPPDDVHYDGLLISGSGVSVHEDIDWIRRLTTYIQRVATERPSMKIFGICFGHHIIAMAFGGACTPNDDHWEVAVTAVQLTPIGKAIFGSDELDLQQMHSDYVSIDPPNAHILGSTDRTPNQGVVFLDASAPFPDDLSSNAPHVPLTSVHILTIQGHPEFTAPLMNTLLDSGLVPLSKEAIREGHVRENGVPGRNHSDGLACDGVDKVGRVIWGMMGIA